MKKIIIIIAAILVVLFLAKDFITGAFMAFGVTSLTDLSASVHRASLGVFKSAVDVRGLKLYNPRRDFKDRVMMDIPELYINYDLGSFLRGRRHLKEIRLHVKEVVVVKNEAGKLNVESIRAIQTRLEQKREGDKRDSKFRIDVLDLKIDNVIYKDYSTPGSPLEKEFKVGIDEHYTNITNPYSFVSLVVFKAVVSTGIASLAHFDFSPLKNAALDTPVNATKKAAEAAIGTVKNLWPFGK